MLIKMTYKVSQYMIDNYSGLSNDDLGKTKTRLQKVDIERFDINRFKKLSHIISVEIVKEDTLNKIKEILISNNETCQGDIVILDEAITLISHLLEEELKTRIRDYDYDTYVKGTLLVYDGESHLLNRKYFHKGDQFICDGYFKSEELGEAIILISPDSILNKRYIAERLRKHFTKYEGEEI